MSNELLFFLFLFLDMTALLVMFRLFGRVGLHAVIVFSIILCNIQVLKTVELFGLVSTLGNVMYGSIFLATDILGECYGEREARKGVFLGFAALLLMTFYMQITLHYAPDATDFAHPHLDALFSWMPRIALASAAAYAVSQFCDIRLFHWIARRTGGRHLWLRNNVATLISQALDTTVFTLIAFGGTRKALVLWQLFLTAMILKSFVALCDTPFVYLARRWAPPPLRGRWKRREQQRQRTSRSAAATAPQASPAA